MVGGGCSGFSYHMAFENQVNEASDNVYEFDGLKVLVDQMSEMYLEGVSIDYIETLEGSGFKFNNPNVKSTCGCGSSFTVVIATAQARMPMSSRSAFLRELLFLDSIPRRARLDMINLAASLNARD